MHLDKPNNQSLVRLPFWLPVLAGTPLALCLAILAVPMLGYGAASVSRTLFLTTFLLWVYPLTAMQRYWWLAGTTLATTAVRLLVVTFAMTLATRLAVMSLLNWHSSGAFGEVDFGLILRGIEGPWLALIAYCAIHTALIYGSELQRSRTQYAEAQLHARDAELKALRLQLQPHFIFNTLNAISALIGEHRGPDAQTMLARLAELLRATLEAPRTHVCTLAEEIALAEAYLEIEQVRLGARLRTNWQIAPGVLAVAVPRLLLQPLLENAIRHGLALRRQAGNLDVVIDREREFLRLIISNDLPEHAPDPGTADRDGIGLNNLRQRLLALYSTEHDMTTYRADGRFHVRLQLPIRLPIH